MSMSHPTHKTIGVIGLGIIGRGVSENLRRKGFHVFVWNRTPRPIPNFVGSPAELAELCDYLQIFVSDDEALLQTVRWLREKLTSRHIVLAHSTVAPDSMRAAADIVEHCGARFVEAPFTGSKAAAEKGELVYYVAGNKAVLREARPILEASSKEIIEIGEIGQATAIKIATNMVTAASVQASAEALALVEASGLPLEKFVEAMESNASHSTTLAMKIPKMIEHDFEPHFSVKHMLKDMQIANSVGLSHDFDLAVTAAARDQLLEQIKRGHGDDDYSAVARKYLPETESAGSEETQTADDQAQAGADAIIPTPETISALAETEEPTTPAQDKRNMIADETTAPASLSGEAEEETQLRRRGFLRQLLDRARQQRSRPISSKQE
jgi:3-hydroxyisobutyrate dehydrogenase-like beta-hydroxyacid dehydrogenase